MSFLVEPPPINTILKKGIDDGATGFSKYGLESLLLFSILI
jgi:hypothetical protein